MLAFLANAGALFLLLFIACSRHASADGANANSLPRSLHAEIVAVACGERACDAQCEADLATRLRSHGPIASLCASALERVSDWPPLRYSWLDILRSHLPTFHLLVRAGRVIEEDADDEWADVWQRILPQAKGWLANLRWPAPRRSQPGFRDFLTTVRQCPSQKMQVELLMLAANALSVGLHHITLDSTEISPRQLEKAVDHLIKLAHTAASNITTTSNPYTPRLFGLLRHQEMRRIRSFEFIARFLPARPTVVFAGAHNGIELRKVLQTWPEGDVHAFEPDPFIFPALHEDFSGAGCRANHAALHARDGQILSLRTRNGLGSQSTLFEPTEGDYQTTWPSIYESLHQGTRRDVMTLALAPYFRRVGVKSVHFIYLDVECSELNALRGAREMLRNVSVLHLEVQNVELCKGGALWPEVLHFLRARGFRPLILPPRPWDVQMDVVLVRDPLPGIQDA